LDLSYHAQDDWSVGVTVTRRSLDLSYHNHTNSAYDGDGGYAYDDEHDDDGDDDDDYDDDDGDDDGDDDDCDDNDDWDDDDGDDGDVEP
jgi:hypothetical protein